MLDINEQSNTSTILNSLDKIYNKAKIKGKFKSINLYVLNIIFKLLNNESLELTDCQRKDLVDLYIKIYFGSENICNNITITKCFIQSPTPFVQEQSTSCTEHEEFDDIYYWQEPTYDENETETILETGFFDNKLFDSKANFINGVDCTFNDVGKLFFAILNTQESNNYRIFDVLNNDITHTFTKLYSEPINAIIFVSNNLYSYSITNLKIKIVGVNQDTDPNNDNPSRLFSLNFNLTYN